MDDAMNVDSGQVKIDEDLHSRQLAVYGKESMKRMANADIVILGLKGLGVEVAKNVILAGVKSVKLYDPTPVEVKDLGTQFYLAQADVGQPTAESCKARLQELNTAVQVSVLDSITEADLQPVQAVVCTTVALAEARKYDELCRAQSPPIPLIYSQTCGVFGQVFCDFGPEFTIFDVDGEPPQTGIVASITQGATTMVYCVEEDRLGFQEGDAVTFSELQGMPELQARGPFRVRAVKPYMLELDVDSSGFAPHESGGIVTQVKEAKQAKHRSLAECVAQPGEFLLSDFSKIERPAVLHVAFQALEAFKAEHGRAPRPGNRDDCAMFCAAFQKINGGLEEAAKAEYNEKVLAQFASTSGAEINPMCAMFGGIVGQEVVKAISGKFGPISQWLYCDSVESLPDEVLPEAEYAATGSRYDHQVAVFGRAVQARLEGLKVFLVGAGALGCEFLKNLALMGVACGEGGGVTVTDDDTIEKSNLSRQFLFRDWDIGAFKAAVAGAAAARINPALRARLLQNRVSVDTEDVFDAAFWQGLDVVVNALDNVHARLYVDSRCVYFQKPLLESGTLGTKCNTQMVIPSLTENYGASRDPPEKTAPMCTLHSFPHNIDHCLTWARSEFEGAFEGRPSEVKAYMKDPAAYAAAARKAGDHTARVNLEAISDCLAASRCATFDDCIAISRRQFEERFNHKIAQLVHMFPEDARTSNGSTFWSPPKRFPRVVTFDAADPSHAAYAQASASLFAEMYGLDKPAWAGDAAEVAKRAAAVKVPAFTPSDNVKIETDPSAKGPPVDTPMAADDETRIEELLAELEERTAKLGPVFAMASIAFEKDDDANGHMDLITALANNRARNYHIPEVEKFKAKLIAGRIIPAIATATALATGLVCLELYKVIQGKPVEAFRSSFANLALPLFAASEPLPMKVTKFKDLSWSLWDRWVLQGDLTVQEVLDWFSAKELEAYSISYGPSLLYNTLFPKHKERLGTRLSELVASVAKAELPASAKHFDIVVACEDEDGEDIDVPLISIEFR